MYAEHDSPWLIRTVAQGMGFTEGPCRHALTVCGNDVNRSVEFLFNGGGQQQQEVVDMTMSPDRDDHDPLEWCAHQPSRSLIRLRERGGALCVLGHGRAHMSPQAVATSRIGARTGAPRHISYSPSSPLSNSI